MRGSGFFNEFATHIKFDGVYSLEDKVFVPMEVKVKQFEETRRVIAEELLKQRPV